MTKTKKILITLPVVAALAISLAYAQMGSGEHDHSASGTHDQAMTTESMSTVESMSVRYKQMTATFNELDDHFKRMMAVSDFEHLRSYMVDHHILMSRMREHMTSQQQGWQQMMSLTHHAGEVSQGIGHGRTGCGAKAQSGCGH